MQQKVIFLEEEFDVGIARMEAAQIAEMMGFDKAAIGQITLGVSEICQNAVRYGRQGKATILSLKNDRVLRIIVEDKGQGIGNMEEALKEGVSTTKTSLGLGLQVAKRSMDKFDIQSEMGKGTKVLLEKYLPISPRVFEYGVVSLADENYLVNGDEFLVKEFDGDKILLAVIDGLGQGKPAHDMASAVKKVLLEQFWESPKKMIEQCDTYLKQHSKEDGGVAMSVAVLSPKSLQYLGVGDTHAYYLNGAFYPMLNIDGRVGSRQLRSLKVQVHSYDRAIIFILCTDGISSRINYEELNWEQSAQQIANQIFNLYHRPYGDATVLVVNYRPDNP